MLLTSSYLASCLLTHRHQAAYLQGSDPWETLVGLELHVQVDSKTKLFSAAPTSVGRQPNTHVSVFDAALPGTLPVINRACVEAAAVTGIALGGNVNRLSSFDRKHYFYADLPHGFQITQLREPIVSGGALDVAVGDTVKRVGIQRIQLEVDTGKSTHDLDPRYSCIDLNRAGSALMEVVTGPDLRSGDEAAAFVRTFQQLLRHVGTSDGNMEDGSLRVDVNVSVRGGGRASSRVEVKNLNSTRSIARAVDHEARRHAVALLAGGDVDKETRSFDARAGITVPLRSKEASLDYRFMVEPDLPPLLLHDKDIERLKASVPELPEAVAARLQRSYGLPASQAKHFTREPHQRRLLEDILAQGLVTADVFSASCPGTSVRHHCRFWKRLLVERGALSTTWHSWASADLGYLTFVCCFNSWGAELEGRSVANIVQGDVLRCAKEAKVSVAALPAAASAERLAELMSMHKNGQLSRGLGKPAIHALVSGDTRDLKEIVSSLSGADDGILGDQEELRRLCAQILAEQLKEVEQYRNGNARKMMSFVGALMKRTKGRADPKAGTAIFQELIDAGTCFEAVGSPLLNLHDSQNEAGAPQSCSSEGSCGAMVVVNVALHVKQL
eukprot:CAMPEP_0117688568 /NCGR_PEP_ID=MMETSP0804-20121206/23918_1 /TAXON_ID=1074897 /ORGANISM="Tetraselmis astigmatica, Strain CCMP880" /LENGTH=613 /DNA_ID=CAMNT_0005501067 /DNA_START=216 /DNA_END=2059 /DNA_ORIENTATION=+